MPVFTDQMQRNVELSSTPQRIISLVPSQTELLYDLGLEAEVIGITKFCVHPEEWFRTKTRVGGTKKLNIELIKGLNPDLIIGNKEENEHSQVEQLMKEYPVWMSDVKNLRDALEMIIQVGEITGYNLEAIDLSGRIQLDFDNLKPDISNLKQSRSAAYLIWHNPIMIAGGDTFINDMLKRCGFTNAFQTANRYPEMGSTELSTTNPDFILLSSEPFPFREKHIEQYKLICSDAEVLLVDGEMFSWYGSRLLKAPAYFQQLFEHIETGN
jgi:ABC-type Fe3+-hydroxamate transport system substrate-binding protein